MPFAGKFREPDVALLIELNAVGRARFGEFHKFFFLGIKAQQGRSTGPDVPETIETNRVHASEADPVHPAPGLGIILLGFAEIGLDTR